MPMQPAPVGAASEKLLATRLDMKTDEDLL